MTAIRLPRVPQPGPRLVTAAVLVLVAAVAAALGGLAVRALTAPRPPAAVAALPVLRTVTEDVFARAQTTTDRRDAPRDAGLVAGSVRRLAVMPNVPAVLSAARTADGDVCLVAAVKQGRQYNADCVPPSVFARSGVSLQWSMSGWSAGEPFVEQGYLPRFFTVVWGPDGHLRYLTHVLGDG